MQRVLLIQLPVPQSNFGLKTGNIPFAAACLQQAAASFAEIRIELLPQEAASSMGDSALLQHILHEAPEVIGFTTYMWNIRRVLWLAREIKTHYHPRILIGGPEATPDNRMLVEAPAVDHLIFGEGEEELVQVLKKPEGAWRPAAPCALSDVFESRPSPYLSGVLDPGIENTMLLETMRGCPYSCAYCYYRKSRIRPAFKKDQQVLEALRWALERGVKEVYFLDPSLNARPALKKLLRRIASLNAEHRLALHSEIRVDHIDLETVDLLAAAGFKEFEIGLQSTNPRALEKMGRNCDLKRFAEGATALKKRSIKTVIDLIVGLPGDDPAGFARTVQFVADHGLGDDLQIFPLAVLPGTDFRKRCQELGLAHLPEPPYTITATPTFSQSDILDAFSLAEEQFDIALHPLPDLNLAWQTETGSALEASADVHASAHGVNLLCKIIVAPNRSPADLSAAADRVTHPYQLLFAPGNLPESCSRTISIFSSANPHTPFEAAFFDPVKFPNPRQLLKAVRLERPHYLDGYLRWMHDRPGNRAVQFTLVTSRWEEPFSGPTQRHIRWWRHPCLPDRTELDFLEDRGFDGILIDSAVDLHLLQHWQDEMAALYQDLLLVGFASRPLQKRWLAKTAPEAYCFSLLP